MNARIELKTSQNGHSGFPVLKPFCINNRILKLWWNKTSDWISLRHTDTACPTS